MTNFCTLFNINYLSRGLAMHHSLENTCGSFHLYVVCFDEKAYNVLTSLDVKTITPIKLSDFEDKALLEVKKTRTAAEYCWTCTPSVIRYCITHYNLDACTYIDADIFFYQSPEILIEEAGGKDVIITKHNYAKEYDQSKTHGIFCVQFMYFRNSTYGMEILDKWRNQCIQWCHAYLEDGKFGDQKYLDEWPETYASHVHVSNNSGAGVAPWNIKKFDLTFPESSNPLVANRGKAGSISPIIFYHFHALKFFCDGKVQYTGSIYNVPLKVKKNIYEKYVSLLRAIEKNISKHIQGLDIHGAQKKAPTLSMYFWDYFKTLLSNLKTGNTQIISWDTLRISNHLHLAKIKSEWHK